MIRRLLNILTLLSALLCLAVASLWLRSRATTDEVYVSLGGRALWRLTSWNGNISVDRFADWPELPPRFRHRSSGLNLYVNNPSAAMTPVYVLRFLGGAYRSEWRWHQLQAARGAQCVVLRADGSVDWDTPALPIMTSLSTARLSAPFPFWSCGFPLGAALGVSSILPALRGTRRWWAWCRSQTRHAEGQCPRCGYDLRATPDRCPECGAARTFNPAA